MPLHDKPSPLAGRLRNLLAFCHDICAIALAWLGAHLLRFNFEVPDGFTDSLWWSLPWVVPLHAVLAWRFGLYRGVWRYASLTDLKRIVLVVSISAVAVVVVVALFSPQGAVPRSVLVIHPLLLVLLMSGSRIAYRIFKEFRLYGHAHLNAEPVLILGAGDQAAALVRELQHSPMWHVVGLLDDDPAKRTREISGVKVLGAIAELADIAPRLSTRYVILALPDASAGARRRAMEVATEAGLRALTVPALGDLLSGRVTLSEIRQIELEDLLGRDAVTLDDEGLHRLLTDRTILITGAGGSIGSELCRQVARFAPARMVLVELSELALYQIEQEFSRSFPTVPILCLVADVRDARRMGEILGAQRPEVMIHAAAYKHVPLMEHHNVWETLRNNVLGTLTVARLAQAHAVGKFVYVSTDKAVNPTSVMGVSKRLSELACQAVQDVGGTSFVVVRFGNVLGSTGSVIPKFRAQIAAGGPVTVTHPEITRYFMTIPEAAQLVLQAGLMGDNGEIFVLDMGDPVRIVDLARDMIRLSGFSEEEIGIVFTGLRPGEKLYEELLADVETTLPTRHPKLRIAQTAVRPSTEWAAALESWLRGEPADSEEAVRAQLQAWVPEYRPSAGSGADGAG